MVLDGNDRETIEGCRQGDPDAFRALFETYKDKVYSIALRYSGNHTAALDIAQETFLKLLSSIRTFRSDASFDSWLYRLVVNSCLDHHRRGRRLMPMVQSWFEAVCSPVETVLQDLMRTELKENVQRAVGRLPAEQRIVVVLRYSEGLSYEQIAGILGCSMGTIASRLNRAHKVLERRLSHLRQVRGGSGE